MSWIPGWDSAAGAGLGSNIFFWAGIIALLFLGVSEVVSHRYGERKDELVSEQQAATERRHDEEMARIHLETAQANERAANLEKETAVANERAAELKLALEKEIAARQPRQIDEQKRSALIAALSKISNKGALTVTWKLFDEEAERFGKQLLDVLKDSGFDAKEARGPFGFGIPGQWVLVRDLKKYQTERSWVGELQHDLNNNLGVTFDGKQMDSAMTPDVFGEVTIAVGAKP